MATKIHCNRVLQCAEENDYDSENEHEESVENFNYELCRAMIAVNMPWTSLNNEVWKNFLEKHTGQPIPNESTLRKNYLNKVYDDIIKKIRLEIGDSCVWISVDETTDKTGRHMANFIVGKMCSDIPTEGYLLCCKQLDSVNFETIARFVNYSILTLWPQGQNTQNILLLVTDAASYMLKAGEYLKVLYPNMKHLTCLVHGIHRVAEEVRDIFPAVDKFISTTKKVFLKSPSRISVYKRIMGNTSLPPRPIITRWGTWIDAAVFHAENFNKIKEIFELLDAKEAKCVAEAKDHLKNEQLFVDLLFIKNHFSIIPATIEKLEAKGMRLTASLEIFFNFKKSMEIVPGLYGEIVVTKLENVLRKNPSFDDIAGLSSIFKNEVETPIKLSIKQEFWGQYMFAPVSSCDVERSFSAYKNILKDKRESFTCENIEKVLIVYCNKL